MRESGMGHQPFHCDVRGACTLGKVGYLLRPLVGRVLGKCFAIQQDRADFGLQQTGAAFEQCAFATAVFADDGIDHSRLEGKIDIPDHIASIIANG